MMRFALATLAVGLTATQASAELMNYDALNGEHVRYVERVMFSNGFHQNREYRSGVDYYESFLNDQFAEEVTMNFHDGVLHSHDITPALPKQSKHHHISDWSQSDGDQPVAADMSRAVDISTLAGARAAGGEQYLTNNGFVLARQSGLVTYWRNNATHQCAKVKTNNGRYADVELVPQNSCR